jgi:DNA-binding GntR family transcriptional regulator
MDLKRASTREQITQLLLDRILSGALKPGERLVEMQIANELNTSQAPVREALRYLEAMRVVESQPYKGTWVREISDRELAESSQVRAALEQLGGELAAKHLKGDVSALEAEAKKFMKAAKAKDFPKYSKHDIEFHRLIMEAAGNQLLLSIWEQVVLEARFRRTLEKIGEENLYHFGEEHLPVIEAMRAEDGKLAGKLLYELIHRFHFFK